MRRVVFSALTLGWIALVSSAVGAQNPGGNAEAKKMKNPVASNAASIAAGKAAYTKNCRFCHGTEAKGNGPMAPEGTHPSDLTDEKWDRGVDRRRDLRGHPRRRRAEVRHEGLQEQDDRAGNLERRELPPEPAGEIMRWLVAVCVLGATACGAQPEPVPVRRLHPGASHLRRSGARLLLDPVEAPSSRSRSRTRSHIEKQATCTDCHESVEKGPIAGIPSVKTCMICHSQIATDRPLIKQITAIRRKGIDIPWQRVYGFTREAHVRFNHAPHIRANVDCATCHGDIVEADASPSASSITAWGSA